MNHNSGDGSGYGSGYGSGGGYGYEFGGDDGDGFGVGFGYGYDLGLDFGGFGSGYGSGYGFDDGGSGGYGFGDGDGFGFGFGDGDCGVRRRKIFRYDSTKRRSVKMRAVIVTTEYRGVFFGYAEDTSGLNITLTRARNCIYWPATNGGFMGLASEGPAPGSRIGPTVEKIDLRKVTAVIEMNEAAVQAWESAKVYRG